MSICIPFDAVYIQIYIVHIILTHPPWFNAYSSIQRESEPAVPTSDCLESFDLVRMERSAQFLSSLFLPLSTVATSTATATGAGAGDGDGDGGVVARQIDEADKEVIRDRLTMLLGRKVRRFLS